MAMLKTAATTALARRRSPALAGRMQADGAQDRRRDDRPPEDQEAEQHEQRRGEVEHGEQERGEHGDEAGADPLHAVGAVEVLVRLGVLGLDLLGDLHPLPVLGGDRRLAGLRVVAELLGLVPGEATSRRRAPARTSGPSRCRPSRAPRAASCGRASSRSPCRWPGRPAGGCPCSALGSGRCTGPARASFARGPTASWTTPSVPISVASAMLADFTGHAAIAVTATMTSSAQPAVVIALLMSDWRERQSR